MLTGMIAITSSPRMLPLNTTTKMFHYGSTQLLKTGKNEDVRLRNAAEVALLSRNIKLYGSDTLFFGQGIGFAIVAKRDALLQLDSVEIRHAGRRGIGDRSAVSFNDITPAYGEQYIRGSSIFRSLNRCVSISNSKSVTVRNNVCVDHVGHGFALVTGTETNVKIQDNLGMTTRAATVPTNLATEQVSTTRNVGPATFYISNPSNVFERNVAAGSAFFGFFLDLPPFYPVNPSYTLRFTPFQAFNENRAHSTRSSAFRFGENYWPTTRVTMKNLQAYRVGGFGADSACLWSDASNILVNGFICADFATGLFLSNSTTIANGALAAYSSNLGSMPSSNPDPAVVQKFVGGYWRNVYPPSLTGYVIKGGPSALLNFQISGFNKISVSDYLSAGITARPFSIVDTPFFSSRNILSAVTVDPGLGDYFTAPRGASKLWDLDGKVVAAMTGDAQLSKLITLPVSSPIASSDSFDVLSSEYCTTKMNVRTCVFGADPASALLFAISSNPQSTADAPWSQAIVPLTNPVVVKRVQSAPPTVTLIPQPRPIGTTLLSASVYNTYQFYVSAAPVINVVTIPNSVNCMALQLSGATGSKTYMMAFGVDAGRTSSVSSMTFKVSGKEVSKKTSIEQLTPAPGLDEVLQYYDSSNKILYVYQVLTLQQPLPDPVSSTGFLRNIVNGRLGVACVV
jgi:hypothetical protein